MLLAGLAAVTLPVPALAQTLPPPPSVQAQKLTLERIFASPALTGNVPRAAKLSPDGKLVASSWPALAAPLQQQPGFADLRTDAGGDALRDLDADLGEEGVDLGHELLNQADVVEGAGDDDGVGAFGQPCRDEVDAHMAVLEHHVTHAQHEHGREDRGHARQTRGCATSAEHGARCSCPESRPGVRTPVFSSDMTGKKTRSARPSPRLDYSAPALEKGIDMPIDPERKTQKHIGGLVTNSLALLADAAHMFTDASALVIALIAYFEARVIVQALGRLAGGARAIAA